LRSRLVILAISLKCISSHSYTSTSNVYSTEKVQKLTHLDEDSIRELVGDDKDKTALKVKKQQLKQQKKQVQARLAQEQKTSNNNSSNKNANKANAVDEDDDDDEEDDLGVFAKSAKTKKR
jgi:hypothetical protein